MAVCEFKPGRPVGGVACDMIEAVKDILARDGIGEIYTAKQIRELVCMHEDPEAREQCRAYPDLAEHGRNSRWARR